MRKWTAVIAVGLIVGFLSLTAEATVTLKPGPNAMKLVDVSGHWSGGVPVLPNVGPAGGDELRAVVSLTGLHTPPTAGVPYWTPSASAEVTGLMYNLELFNVGGLGLDSSGLPQTGTILYYRPLGRNPLVVADDNFGPGGVADIGNVAAPLFGGVLELYDDSSPDLGVLTATDPNNWVGGAGASDSFVNATDGTPWLSGVFLELNAMGTPAPLTAVYQMQFLTATKASGFGFINIFDGSQKDSVDPWAFGPYVDATFATTINLTPVGAATLWQATSFDPIEIDIIPEPTIMVLFGASILGGLIRRRF